MSHHNLGYCPECSGQVHHSKGCTVEVQELNEALTERDRRIEAFQKQADQLRTALAAAEADNERVVRNNGKLCVEIEELRTQLAAAGARAVEAEGELFRLRDDNAWLGREEAEALRAEVAALKAENASDRAIQGDAEHRALERADRLLAALRKAGDSMANVKHCVDLALFNLASITPPNLGRAAHYLRLPSDEWPTIAAIDAALAAEGSGG